MPRPRLEIESDYVRFKNQAIAGAEAYEHTHEFLCMEVIEEDETFKYVLECDCGATAFGHKVNNPPTTV